MNAQEDLATPRGEKQIRSSAEVELWPAQICARN